MWQTLRTSWLLWRSRILSATDRGRASPLAKEVQLWVEPLGTRALLSAAPGLEVIPLPTTRDFLTAAAAASTPQAAFFPLGQTFQLSSNPTASHTIYLDFNGHTTTGTPWNEQLTNNQPIVTPAFNADSNPTVFSDAELMAIQEVFLRVAEDFAPFNVNVTTQDPGVANLIHSGAGDSRWGIRVIIGGDGSWLGPAGGVAFLHSFDSNIDIGCFVFSENLSDVASFIAEAASHEVGHTVGLEHDGRTSPAEEYFRGHGTGVTSWAPIMGVGYNRSVTQWSRGEYAAANNPEDDLIEITTGDGFSFRADDHGNTNATASTLNPVGNTMQQSGIISRTSDVDVFAMNLPSGGSPRIRANPASVGANLDIAIRIFNSLGVQVASSMPGDILTVDFRPTLGPGAYFIHVSGSGDGIAATDGYSNYGSLGQYTLIVEGATPTGSSITGVVFNDPNGNGVRDAGESPLSGWRVYLDSNQNGQWDSGTETSQLSDLSGNYNFISLGAGNYRVGEVVQSGWQQTSPPGTGFYEISLASSQQFTNANFGNRQTAGGLDIRMRSATADGGNTLTLQYEILGGNAPAFQIAVMLSEDLLVGVGDTALSTISVTNAADLTQGLHTLQFTIGAQVNLPGAGVADDFTDRRILFVADNVNAITEDDAHPLNEDNSISFRGVYKLPGLAPLMVYGGDLSETITVNGGASPTLNLAGTVFASTSVSAIHIRGLGGADVISASGTTIPVLLYGGLGNDSILGGSQDDIVAGGGGDDAINGAAGNDHYMFQGATLGLDNLFDISGVDTLDFSGMLRGVQINLSSVVQQLVNTDLSVLLESATVFENLIGSNFNDILTGNSLDNTVEGLLGDDLIYTAQGNDRFIFRDGTLGSDTLSDTAGIETIDFSQRTVAVALNLGLTSMQVVGGGLSIRLVSGSAMENLIGGTNNDTLTGNAVANVIIGGPGSDTMNGGGSNDTFVFQDTAVAEIDIVAESAGGGVDTLDFSQITTDVTANIGVASGTVATHLNRTVRSTSPANLENILGGLGGDSLTGNASANLLRGGSGNDTLRGNGGDDRLIGEGGDDSLIGGPGGDSYVFGVPTTAEADTITEDASAGIDTLDFSELPSSRPVTVDLSSNTVATHTGRMVTMAVAGQFANLENAIGGAGNDTLQGNSGNNTLFGRSGNDTLRGLDGNDVLHGELGNDALIGGNDNDTYVFAAATAGFETDTITELLLGGIDRLDFSALTTSINVNLSNTGSTGIATHANRTVNVASAGQAANLENVTGGSGNDTIRGNSANNTLAGGGGDDTIFGMDGNDALDGGAGTDTLDGGNGVDTAIRGETLIDIP